MKKIFVLLSFLMMNSTSAKTQVVHMCDRLTVQGYFLHARITNSSDFEMNSSSKYSLEIASLTGDKSQATDIEIDQGLGKEVIHVINSCNNEAENMVAVD